MFKEQNFGVSSEQISEQFPHGSLFASDLHKVPFSRAGQIVCNFSQTFQARQM